jgi:hypothetical protein
MLVRLLGWACARKIGAQKRITRDSFFTGVSVWGSCEDSNTFLIILAQEMGNEKNAKD